MNIKRKNVPIKVDPFFTHIADKYRKNFEIEFGFPIPRTQVTKQMAEVFDKMLTVNGMPVMQKKNEPKKRSKVKHALIFWEFEY